MLTVAQKTRTTQTTAVAIDGTEYKSECRSLLVVGLQVGFGQAAAHSSENPISVYLRQAGFVFGLTVVVALATQKQL